MEQKKHNIAFTAAKIAVTMAIFVLIAYFISILSGFSPFFDGSAHANAKRDVRADSENVTEIFSTHFTNLYAIAEELTFAKSKEEIDEKLGKHIGMDEFGDLRYFTNGVEYAANGLMIENEEASAEAKAEAAAKISKIAVDMQNEANIETLVKAKGFEECVAVITDDSVSVIVKADELMANQAAQILAIVYETTGISTENISIINK